MQFYHSKQHEPVKNPSFWQSSPIICTFPSTNCQTASIDISQGKHFHSRASLNTGGFVAWLMLLLLSIFAIFVDFKPYLYFSSNFQTFKTTKTTNTYASKTLPFLFETSLSNLLALRSAQGIAHFTSRESLANAGAGHVDLRRIRRCLCHLVAPSSWYTISVC